MEKKTPASGNLKSELFFGFHLLVTLTAWVAPFLFSWKWSLPVYAAVMLQFAFFGKCLMNEQHDMTEDDHATFYSYLFEKMGFRPNRKRLKFYVRKVYYPVLATVALIWQEVLKFEPLLF
jgi:hypothetical protein